jgi:hypothetical protein
MAMAPSVTGFASGRAGRPRIRYQLTITLDSDEELSDASQDALAAALVRVIPGARRIICARAGSADPDDEGSAGQS